MWMRNMEHLLCYGSSFLKLVVCSVDWSCFASKEAKPMATAIERGFDIQVREDHIAGDVEWPSLQLLLPLLLLLAAAVLLVAAAAIASV